MYMRTEEEWSKYLRDNSTDPGTLDPTKPFVLDGEMMSINPRFSLGAIEAEFRENYGTSFFMNFADQYHQLPGQQGQEIRQLIAAALRFRFVKVANAVMGKPPHLGVKKEAEFEIAISGQEVDGFHHGEVYIWLPGTRLEEDMIWRLLQALRQSLMQRPIEVMVETGRLSQIQKNVEIHFYGWGFRCWH